MKHYKYYENGFEEILSTEELKNIFNNYSVEERQHEIFEDWLEENIKMQILIEANT